MIFWSGCGQGAGRRDKLRGVDVVTEQDTKALIDRWSAGEIDDAELIAGLEAQLGRPLTLLERADLFSERIRTAGLREIAKAHAAGVSAYYMLEYDPRIVRHDPDGRRFFVRLSANGTEEILSEVPKPE